MPSLQLYLFDKLFRIILKRRFRRTPDMLELRIMMAKFARSAPHIPRGIRLEAASLDGVKIEKLEDVSGKAAPDRSRAILYVHGGGFVSGSPVNHRPITKRLARGVGCPVYAVDYRLAPEHPFPAGLDDVVTAYRALLANGIAPGHIAVAGDSAGGNLVLAMALRLKQLEIPQPGALVAMSAPTDFVKPFESRTRNAKSDAMFEVEMFPSVFAHYFPGRDGTDPLLSPLRGDVSGLPPTLLMCSEIEMLRDDSVEMAAKMKAAGVKATLEVWPDVFHAWPVLADFVPESLLAAELIVAFIRQQIGSAER